VGPRAPGAAATAVAKPKTLAARQAPPQKNAPSKKTVSRESKNLRNREGFPSRLSFHRNRLQFEMSADQQRPRSDEFPRRIVLGCKVARINRVESSKKLEIRARDLHVHQVIHGHARLRQGLLL